VGLSNPARGEEEAANGENRVFAPSLGVEDDDGSYQRVVHGSKHAARSLGNSSMLKRGPKAKRSREQGALCVPGSPSLNVWAEADGLSLLELKKKHTLRSQAVDGSRCFWFFRIGMTNKECGSNAGRLSRDSLLRHRCVVGNDLLLPLSRSTGDTRHQSGKPRNI